MNEAIRHLAARGLVIILFAFPFLYLSEYSLTYWHEQTHKQIYAYYGINSTSTEINPFFLSGETVAENSENCTFENGCEKYHLVNEFIGYYLTAIVEIAWLIVIFRSIIEK